jgi:hypothetical protein
MALGEGKLIEELRRRAEVFVEKFSEKRPQIIPRAIKLIEQWQIGKNIRKLIPKI